jgi:hypothetical protein
MQRKYVSLDPGGTTGISIFMPDHLHVQEADRWYTTTRGPEEHHLQLYDWLSRAHADHRITQVICERFNYQRRDIEKGVSLVLISREYIGVIKLWCIQNIVPLYMAQVGNKDFWSDKNLKDLGLYAGTQHERDATAHLLWYMTNIEKDHQFLKVKRSR